MIEKWTSLRIDYIAPIKFAHGISLYKDEAKARLWSMAYTMHFFQLYTEVARRLTRMEVLK